MSNESFLEESFSRGIARKFCNEGSAFGEECEWYHGNWNLLRRLGMVSNPYWHEEFYLHGIMGSIRENNGGSRILISGAADEAMLSCVLNAAGSSTAEIHMIDLCQTPLEIAKAYANSHGRNVKTLKCDARKMQFEDGYFSLIVTDAFLTRFEPRDRRLIVNEWRRVLKENGKVVTTARIESNCNGRLTSSFSDIARYVGDAVLRGIEKRINPIRVISSAFIYSSRIDSRPFHNVEEVRGLFGNFSGVKIEVTERCFKEVETKGYARIEAIK
jgi:SAM-dependent methyltransferase